ncbi:MAG: translation initiation factor [Verrucomicrobiota bacterium]
MSAPSSEQPPGQPHAGEHAARVEIHRHTAGRSGKTVTIVSGTWRDWLAEGGTVKQIEGVRHQQVIREGRIEIQGDKRNEVARILTEAGFRPVFAGG